MDGFAIKASLSEIVSLGEGSEKIVGVQVFLAEGCREGVFVNKDEVGFVDSFERKHKSDTWCFLCEYGVGREQGLKLNE